MSLQDEWIATIFAQPVGEWYPDDEAVDLTRWRKCAPQEQLELMLWCFSDPTTAFQGLSDDQIAQGLIVTVHDSFLNWATAMLDDDLPRDRRLQAIDSMVVLFRKLFTPDRELSERLEAVCFMWWDWYPNWGTDEPAIDEACIAAMTQILGLKHRRCWESALHGLNHWTTNYSQRVAQVIDAFLQRHPNLDAELISTAQASKLGHCQ